MDHLKWLNDVISCRNEKIIVHHVLISVIDSERGSGTGSADRHFVRQSCRSCHYSNGDASCLPQLLLAHPECFAAARRATATVMETLYYHIGKKRCYINVFLIAMSLSWQMFYCIFTLWSFGLCRHLPDISVPTWCSCIALHFCWPAARGPGSEVFKVLPLKSSACRRSTNF